MAASTRAAVATSAAESQRPAPEEAAAAALPPAVLAGLIGSGIQASRTPAMHEREGEAQGLRYVYRLLDLDRLGLGIEDLPELLTGAERFGFAGLNITHPCKQAVLPLLHALSPDAAAIGAVNTVVLAGGKRIGHNTDCSGFAESFRREMGGAPTGSILLAGAGGAGAAVAHALLGLGAGELLVFDAETARSEWLAEGLRTRFGKARARATGDAAAAIAAADGLVNATPVGMAKYPGMPVTAGLLRPDLWVADIIYFPAETELLRQARALGCRTMGGAGMALFQAVDAFRLFTGREPDAERMRRHFQSG